MRGPCHTGHTSAEVFVFARLSQFFFLHCCHSCGFVVSGKRISVMALVDILGAADTLIDGERDSRKAEGKTAIVLLASFHVDAHVYLAL